MQARDRSFKIIDIRQRTPSPSRRVSRTGKVYCRFGCGKKCTKGGIHSHELHHCPRNPNRKERQFGRERCVICGKNLHGHRTRVHMATQHAGVTLGMRSLSPVVPSARQVSTSPRRNASVCSTQRSPRARGSSPDKAAAAQTVIIREPNPKGGCGRQLPAKSVELPASLAGGQCMSPAVRRAEIAKVIRRMGLG